jgi:hypothetical protein
MGNNCCTSNVDFIGGRTSIPIEAHEHLPSFYLGTKKLTRDDLVIAAASWDSITSPIRHSSTYSFDDVSPSIKASFYDMFYVRLNRSNGNMDSILTDAPLFREIPSQFGLIYMDRKVTEILQLLRSRVVTISLQSFFIQLTLENKLFGMTARKYKRIAEAFFFSLGDYLGEAWTKRLENAWKSILSFIITMVLPPAITADRLHDGKQYESPMRRNETANYQIRSTSLQLELELFSEGTLTKCCRDASRESRNKSSSHLKCCIQHDEESKDQEYLSQHTSHTARTQQTESTISGPWYPDAIGLQL